MLRNISAGVAFFGLITASVGAQETTPSPPRSVRQQSVAKVVAKLAEDTHANVLVPYRLSQQTVLAPEASVTPANLEETLTILVHRLSAASWAKVYLPPPAGGKRYRAEAVAQLVQAQNDVFGRPDKSQPGTALLSGKWMTAEQAKPYIKDLGLEPYYVLMSRSGSPAVPDVPGVVGGPASAALSALMKQIGVSSPRDIPTGEYDVTVDANGTPRTYHVKVENSEGHSSISLSDQPR